MKALIVGCFGRTASGRGLSPEMLRATAAALLVATALAAHASGQIVPVQGTRIFAVPLQPATAVAAGAVRVEAPAPHLARDVDGRAVARAGRDARGHHGAKGRREDLARRQHAHLGLHLGLQAAAVRARKARAAEEARVDAALAEGIVARRVDAALDRQQQRVRAAARDAHHGRQAQQLHGPRNGRGHVHAQAQPALLGEAAHVHRAVARQHGRVVRAVKGGG